LQEHPVRIAKLS